MTDSRRTRTDEELHELLRLGDPAADGSEPVPDELARMRRAVLAAAEAPAPRRVLGPALAAAAVLLIAVAGWVLVRGLRAPEPVVAGGSRAVPDEVPQEVATTETAQVPESIEPVYDRPENVDVPREAATPIRPPEVTVASLDRPSGDTDSARTVRYTTAGGTRIVWVLDPNLDI